MVNRVRRNRRTRKRWRLSIAEEHQRACVREICIANQVPDDVGGKEPTLWKLAPSPRSFPSERLYSTLFSSGSECRTTSRRLQKAVRPIELS